ncbi:hypothetical protein TNCV_4686231 [Trichonephila clavipes]|nr:hypothetical protein TNCV_4686231 [Trichonephila clavipes]
MYCDVEHLGPNRLLSPDKCPNHITFGELMTVGTKTEDADCSPVFLSIRICKGSFAPGAIGVKSGPDSHYDDNGHGPGTFIGTSASTMAIWTQKPNSGRGEKIWKKKGKKRREKVRK